MGWLNGLDLLRSSATAVLIERGVRVAPLTASHQLLFWNRLAGPAGLPYRGDGELGSGGWIDAVRALAPQGLVLVGLMHDVAVFGDIGATVAAAKALVDTLGIEPGQCILSPVSVWSEAAPTHSDWAYWIGYGYSNGFTNWLVDVTPYNRLWMAGTPISRYGSPSDYVSALSDTVAFLKSVDPRMRLYAPVYWDPSSEWGVSLLESLLGLDGLDEIVVSGLLPIPRELTDPQRLWASCVRYAEGALQVRAQAPSRIRTVLPVCLAVPSGSDPPAHTAEYEPRNTAPFGALACSLIACYLVEHGGFSAIAYWQQPVSEASGLVGVRLCDQHGRFSSAGCALEWLSRMRGECLAVSGSARYLDAEDDTGRQRTGPAGAMLVTARDEHRLQVLFAQLNGTEPVQWEWYGASASWTEFVSTADAGLLTEPAELTFGLDHSSTGHRVVVTSPSGSGVWYGDLWLLPTPQGSLLGVQAQPTPQGLQRADGIGDLDDLLVSLELEHASVSSPGSRLVVGVHSGTYYLQGTERRFYVEPRTESLSVPAGISTWDLSVPCSLREPPMLVDARGSFLLVYGSVRCAQPIDGQQVERDGARYWSFQVPGRVVEVRRADTLEPLYPAPSLARLTPHAYYLSEADRLVYTQRSEVLFDYVPDRPSLWIEEYSWCEDGRYLLSRRIPYLPSAVAVQVGTGKLYVPEAIEEGRWRFPAIPPGMYLLRYLVDRSFLVDGTRLEVFSAQPSRVKLVYGATDSEWRAGTASLALPDDVDVVGFVYLWDSPSAPPRVPARMVLEEPDLVLPGWDRYHVRVLVLAEDNQPVPDALVRQYRISGNAVVTPAFGDWSTDRFGRLLLRVSPGTEWTSDRLVVHGSSVETVLVVPPRLLSDTEGGSYELRRLKLQGEYDLCLLRVSVPNLWGRYTVSVECPNGWVAQHLVEGEPERSGRIEFEVPSAARFSGQLFSSVGWCVFRVAPYPVRLIVSVSDGTRVWRFDTSLQEA